MRQIPLHPLTDEETSPRKWNDLHKVLPRSRGLTLKIISACPWSKRSSPSAVDSQLPHALQEWYGILESTDFSVHLIDFICYLQAPQIKDKYHKSTGGIHFLVEWSVVLMLPHWGILILSGTFSVPFSSDNVWSVSIFSFLPFVLSLGSV